MIKDDVLIIPGGDLHIVASHPPVERSFVPRDLARFFVTSTFPRESLSETELLQQFSNNFRSRGGEKGKIFRFQNFLCQVPDRITS